MCIDLIIVDILLTSISGNDKRYLTKSTFPCLAEIDKAVILNINYMNVITNISFLISLNK